MFVICRIRSLIALGSNLKGNPFLSEMTGRLSIDCLNEPCHDKAYETWEHLRLHCCVFLIPCTYSKLMTPIIIHLFLLLLLLFSPTSGTAWFYNAVMNPKHASLEVV